MRTIDILPTLRSLSLVLPLALGAVILLAACTGSGSDSSDAGSTATPQGTQTPTEAGTPEATQEPTTAGTPEATQAPPEETAESTGAAGEFSVNNPCPLLSEDEVEAALGNPVQEGNPRLGCPWRGGSDGMSASLFLSSIECTGGRPDGSEDVSGLGVEAWWKFREHSGEGTVTACPEGWTVNLVVVREATGASEATLRAAAKELIAKVLERL